LKTVKSNTAFNN